MTRIRELGGHPRGIPIKDRTWLFINSLPEPYIVNNQLKNIIKFHSQEEIAAS